jgi:hypothetical protein
MPIYQVHLKLPRNHLYALPVFGTRETVWDALARHMHFRTFRKWCEVTGSDAKRTKARFHLQEVRT